MNRLGRYSSIVAGVAVVGAIAVWLGRSAEEPLQSQAPARTPEPSQDRERFLDEVGEFFARAPALSPEDRAARAREIAHEITQREAKGEVAAAEALTLRTALIRATVEDPVEQVVAIRALRELYQQQGERETVLND